MSIAKALEAITEADLQSLIQGAVPESKVIEYKVGLPTSSLEDRKEFLADVSSFANSAGGDLLFGVQEDKGVPTAIRGLAAIDVDGEMSRLQNMLRDGLEPRLPGVHLHAVPTVSGPVILIRIARSWVSPHRVTLNHRFFARNSNGKYPLDVGELRVAFGLTESAAERIRSFRVDRLARIVGGTAPVPLPPWGKLVLHLVPFGAFTGGTEIDVAALYETDRSRLTPTPGMGVDSRFNFEGVVAYETLRHQPRRHSQAYLQVFRSGAIERTSCELTEPRENGARLLYEEFDRVLVAQTKRLLGIQVAAGVEPPVVVMLSLVDAKGYFFQPVLGSVPLDRDILAIPEVVLDDIGCDVRALAGLLRSTLDTVWQSFGYLRSTSYDAEGNPNFL